MPLPAALQARLAKRGLIKDEELGKQLQGSIIYFIQQANKRL